MKMGGMKPNMTATEVRIQMEAYERAQRVRNMPFTELHFLSCLLTIGKPPPDLYLARNRLIVAVPGQRIDEHDRWIMNLMNYYRMYHDFDQRFEEQLFNYLVAEGYQPGSGGFYTPV
jgi:hypothetical protein